MSYESNGYLVRRLHAAANDGTSPDHSDADLFLKKFRALEATFFNDVHPYVDVGLAISEVRIAGEGRPNIFTVHGCRHIADLIKSLDKISEAIVKPTGSELSISECYILLCAAHVHDGANIKKRDGHPQRCDELLVQYKNLFASSAVSQSVYEVASVHGGSHPTFGRDTIRGLDRDNGEDPRIPLLAAMLRIADELSENPERVPELLEKNHEPSDASKLAFAYAKSFSGFTLTQDNLSVTFGVYPEEASLTGRVNGREVGFFDFLEAKLDVIDKEARYCSQYGRPLLCIEKVSVAIRCYEKSRPSPVRTTLAFSWLLMHGYPGDPEPICKRSPELRQRGATSLRTYFGQVRVSSKRSSALSWLKRILGAAP